MLSQHQELLRFLLNSSHQMVEAAYLLLLAKHLSLCCILQKDVLGFQSHCYKKCRVVCQIFLLYVTFRLYTENYDLF